MILFELKLFLPGIVKQHADVVGDDGCSNEGVEGQEEDRKGVESCQQKVED